MKPYHVATLEERQKFCQGWGLCDTYDLLVGPAGFSCFLGEPEDRTWLRDVAAVVEQLNRLHELLAVAKCPECDGSGFVVRETGGCDADGENDTRECIQEQCRWCYERELLGCCDVEEGKK